MIELFYTIIFILATLITIYLLAVTIHYIRFGACERDKAGWYCKGDACECKYGEYLRSKK